MKKKNKSRPQSSVRRSLRSNACKRVVADSVSAQSSLDLTAINSCHDPDLKAYFCQAVENELEVMFSPKHFGLALERASLRVAFKYAHMLPVDQQVLLASTSLPSYPVSSHTAA